MTIWYNYYALRIVCNIPVWSIRNPIHCDYVAHSLVNVGPKICVENVKKLKLEMFKSGYDIHFELCFKIVNSDCVLLCIIILLLLDILEHYCTTVCKHGKKITISSDAFLYFL